MKYILLFLILLLSSQVLSQNISKHYERSKEAVVLIKTFQTDISFNEGEPFITPLSTFGSGFVISNEGEILTAAYLVQTAEMICVTFSDGEELLAKVIYSYPLAGVALIKLTAPKSTPLVSVKMGDSDRTNIGDQVFLLVLLMV